MKIGIDARLYGPQIAGIGRYVERLVTNLEKLDRKNKYTVFLRQDNFDQYQPENPNFRKVLVSPRWYSLREQIFLPVVFGREKLDLLHVPHFNAPIFYPGKLVITVHDLIKDEWNPEAVTSHSPLVYSIKYFGYQIVINRVLRKASTILTPSNYVKDKIVKKYGIDPRKIVVTYEAGVLEKDKVRSNKERAVEDVIRRFKINSPYFLYVGNVYPHKNVGRLLDAIKMINEKLGKIVYLVLVGARNDESIFRKRLERQILEKDVLKYVTLAGHVSDPDLIDLYRGAVAYVQPSLSEGFGLTSVESMMLGTPVVESKTSCLPEIAQDAALYFDPYDISDIAEKLTKILEDGKMRQELSRKGIERAKKFSWERLARETLKVYESVG